MSTTQHLPSLHVELSSDLPRKGKLSETPAYVILLWLTQQKVTGRVVFERDQRLKELYIKEGELWTSRSNLVPEGLDMYLAKGFLPPTAVSDLQGVVGEPDESYDQRILEAAQKRKLLTDQQMSQALRDQHLDRLLNLFGWFDGTYSITEVGRMPRRPLSADAISIEGLLNLLETILVAPETPMMADIPVTWPALLSESGDLRSFGGAAVTTLYALHQASGQLLFERGQRRKLYQFKQGKIISAASTDPAETLGATLQRWKYLKGDVVDRLESTVRTQGGRLRDLIRREQLLSDEELAEALRTLHLERVLEIFSWRTGAFAFRGEWVKQISRRPRPERRRALASTLPKLESEPREITERELLISKLEGQRLSDSLGVLFQQKAVQSVCIAGFDHPSALVTRMVDTAEAWEANGGRTLVIDASGLSTSLYDPILPELEERWREHLETPNSKTVDRLSIASESASWRSAEGIARFRRWTASLKRSYERILWVGPVPSRGSPLLDGSDRIVFLIEANRTSKADLFRALDEITQTKIAGFLFQEAHMSKSPFWDRLQKRFRPRPHPPM